MASIRPDQSPRRLRRSWTPWAQNPAFRALVRRIRRRAAILRPLHIVTAGPISLGALKALQLELQLAASIAGPLPGGLLHWHALDSGLSKWKIGIWRRRLQQCGLRFRAEPSRKTLPSVAGMYSARQAARRTIAALPENAIVCWLDSDLETTTLCPGADGEPVLMPALPWLHLVWRYAERHPHVRVAVGDVVGDPPIPASATLFANLRDLLCARAHPNLIIAGEGRWFMRDAAYDLSDVADRAEDILFPLLHQSGDFQPLQYGIAQALLWRGTLARPLVANSDTMFNPHRPWYIRGGLTILFDKSLAAIPVPCFSCEGMPVRRGDSFWMLKAASAQTAGHFPYPLLHRRGAFAGSTDALIDSFIGRGLSGFIGSSAIKAAGKAAKRGVTRAAMEEQIGIRHARAERCLALALQLLRNHRAALPRPTHDAISQACAGLLHALRSLGQKECALQMCRQINHYLQH